MKDSAIIVSGGMDSITMLYEYQAEIALGKYIFSPHGKLE